MLLHALYAQEVPLRWISALMCATQPSKLRLPCFSPLQTACALRFTVVICQLYCHGFPNDTT
jgi:hypothetical protein